MCVCVFVCICVYLCLSVCYTVCVCSRDSVCEIFCAMKRKMERVLFLFMCVFLLCYICAYMLRFFFLSPSAPKHDCMALAPSLVLCVLCFREFVCVCVRACMRARPRRRENRVRKKVCERTRVNFCARVQIVGVFIYELVSVYVRL